MKLFTSAVAILLAAGAASAQVAYHDNGTTYTGSHVSGPLTLNHGPSQRGSGVVYSSTTETGVRANGGVAGFYGTAPADNSRVLFDDVPISNDILGDADMLNVTRVTVGIRRLAGAPATDVNVFWSTLSTSATAPDTQLDTPPVGFGTVSLGVAAATVTELVTFGASGGPTLFSVPLNSDLISGFGMFSIGVSFSSTDNNNGWRLTNGPSPNANILWMYDPNHSASANDELGLVFSNTNPPNPLASFYLIVEGTPVPAPGAAALLGLGSLVAIRRRR